MLKTTQIFIILALTSLAAGGCLFVDHDPDCVGDDCYADGDIAFFWSFELADGGETSSCNLSGVARVDVEVFDEYGYSEFAVYDLACDSEGAVLTDFLPGAYEIQLVAYCRTGEPTHEAWFDLWVDSGFNDYGVLMLDYLGPCL